MNDTQPICVVLVDDHQIVRRGIREFLIENGIQVIAEAGDGSQAVELIRQHRPDVAVLDIQLPGQSGIEVARTIREEGLPVGILILSAHDDDPFVIAAVEAGVNGYVLKTADPREIVSAVRAVHEGQSVLDPKIVGKVMHAIANPSGQDMEYEELSSRELEVLREAARGLTSKAIGVSLQISDRTVQAHLGRIFEKLRVSNRTEAVVRATQLGLLDLPES